MSRICKITGKKGLSGNRRSHALNARKRRFSINLQNHRFWIPEENRFIKIRVSSKGLRMINKFGISEIYKKIY